MKQDRMLLRASMVSFAVLAASFLLMAPLTDARLADILAGACFWLALITGCVCQGLLTVSRKKWEKKTETAPQDRIGLLSFCRNPKGKHADILLLVSSAGLLLSLWLTDGKGFICYIFLSLTVLAFSAHCVYNGKNYNYMQTRKKSKSGRRARQRRIQHEE